MLSIPAAAMGIGFPLILRAAAGTSLTLGQVYGLNTLGGAFGAVLPLILLPAFGWATAMMIVAALGVTTALLALSLSSALRGDISRPLEWQPPPRRSMLAYAGVGAAALLLEIGWTRLFGTVFLRTEYVLAVILMVFLVGIGLGSLLVRRGTQVKFLTWLPVLAAGGAITSLWLLPQVAAWIERARFESLTKALWWEGLAIGLLTLPVTLVLGAWLPLLSAYHGGDGRTGAWLYGANALGAAAGAGLAGLLLIPMLGTPATIVCGALLLFLCGIIWSGSRRVWFALPVLLIAAVPVYHFPAVSQLLPAMHGESRDLYRYEDAVSITHVIERVDGQRLLLSDLQRMDASSDPTSVALQRNQARLPLLLHAQSQRVLFLGFGTGISASGAMAFPALDITAVELSRGAITAASDWFAEVNNDVSRHITIRRDDVRHFLKASPQTWDVIVGDVFHPDLVGRSALLSVQQFQRARDHLDNDGLFVQWLALNQFDVPSLQVILRSFAQVFPDAVMFLDGFRLALVGSTANVSAAPVVAAYRQSTPEQRATQSGGEGIWSWLGRYWGGLNVAPGPVQDEWSPELEYRLPRARYSNEIDIAATLDWLTRRRPSFEQAASELGIADENRHSFERAYAATELAARAWLAELQGDELAAQRQIRLAYRANPQDRWVSTVLADKMYETLPAALRAGRNRREALQAILAIRPDHIEALRDLWQLERDDGNADAAERYRRRLRALSPFDIKLSVN